MEAREAHGLMDLGVIEALADTRTRHGQRWPDIGHDEDTRCWRASRPVGDTGSHHITARTLSELAGLLDAEAAR